MSEFFDRLTPELIKFFGAQPIFFVATAAPEGRINLSPKGMDTYGSRSLVVGAVAVVNATEKVIEKARRVLGYDPQFSWRDLVMAVGLIAVTLLGWGIGGLLGGILADYIGRRRTMIYAILAYSLMTGLSAFAWDWMSFAALRFLVGVAIGERAVLATSAEGLPDLAVEEVFGPEGGPEAPSPPPHAASGSVTAAERKSHVDSSSPRTSVPSRSGIRARNPPCAYPSL